MRFLLMVLIFTLLGPWFRFPAVHASGLQETAEYTDGGSAGSAEEEGTEEAEETEESLQGPGTGGETEAAAEGTAADREPVRQDALTQEQIDEGWELIGGYAYPPEELEGDSGYVTGGTGSFSNSTTLSNVTIVLDLPEGQTDPFVLYFVDASSYQEYYVTLYASNGYRDTFKLPVGAYYFTGGGPEGDYMSVYDIVSPVSFVVEKDTDLYLEPVVTTRAAALQASAETESAQEEAETEEAEETETAGGAEEESAGTPWYAYLGMGFAFLAGAALVSFAALKYGKHKEEV